MHYYTNNVNARSDEKDFGYTLRGCNFKFTTDIGVFSKREVDFGSRLLVESYTAPEVDGNILDVGCGYGPIGLSLAKSYVNRNIHMVDVNQRALELSKKNAQDNGISNATMYESFCYDGVEGEFAAILSNPPIRAGKKVVHAIIEEASEGGHRRFNRALSAIRHRLSFRGRASSATKRSAELNLPLQNSLWLISVAAFIHSKQQASNNRSRSH